MALTVSELVAIGRTPHRGWLPVNSQSDELAIAHALRETDLEGLADRHVDQLSGGERQRALVAMALAQGSDVLLLDEPTTHLDLAHQLEVLRLLRRLTDAGRLVVAVLHDLQLASRYADYVIGLRDRSIIFSGPPTEVITRANVRRLFDIEAVVLEDTLYNRPLVIPVD